MIIAIVGFIASFTSTVSLVPQIYQTYKTKSVGDISLLMLINFTICSISWIIYGVLTGTKSVYLTNIAMTICSVFLLTFKLKYTKK